MVATATAGVGGDVSVVVVDEAGQGDGRRLRRLAEHLFTQLRLAPSCELGITLVDQDRMTALHVEWMGEPGPTDVLSFPIDELREPANDEPEATGTLGDIVLCPSFAARQAAEAGRSLDDELDLLVTHGVLHLLGHDHATTEEYQTMFARQDELLAAWRATGGSQ